jgi:1-acyl-sn-glycerol-3-phosphate acyltransferase
VTRGRRSGPVAALQLACVLLGLVLAVAGAFLTAPFRGAAGAFWSHARAFARMALKVWGVDHGVSGLEALPPGLWEGRRPAVFIANHASNLDAIALACHLGCRPAVIAKREMRWAPLLGQVLWLSGSVFIDRRNREKAIQSLQAVAHRVREGLCLLAFPEGTRSRDGRTLPFKKGLFILAHEAGVPIVPMGIQGSHALLPPGQWRCAPGRISIRVGPALHPQDFSGPDALREAAEAAVAELTAG